MFKCLARARAMKTFSSWDKMGFVLKSLFGLEKLSPKSQM